MKNDAYWTLPRWFLEGKTWDVVVVVVLRVCVCVVCVVVAPLPPSPLPLNNWICRLLELASYSVLWLASTVIQGGERSVFSRLVGEKAHKNLPDTIPHQSTNFHHDEQRAFNQDDKIVEPIICQLPLFCSPLSYRYRRAGQKRPNYEASRKHL